jgi:hypothetical protein
VSQSLALAIPGGDDVRGAQLAGCCKHDVRVCDYGDTSGGADDEATAGVGSSIRRVLQTLCGRVHKLGQRRGSG